MRRIRSLSMPSSQDFSNINTASKYDFRPPQFKKQIPSFGTDRRKPFQINDEVSALEVSSCVFVRIREFLGPRRNQRAFDDHPALARGVNERNFQHARIDSLNIGNPRAKGLGFKLLAERAPRGYPFG
jgi:hypothetical protein